MMRRSVATAALALTLAGGTAALAAPAANGEEVSVTPMAGCGENMEASLNGAYARWTLSCSGGQITVISIQPGTTYIQPGTTYRETIVVTAPGGGTSVVTSVVERTVQQTVVSTAPGGGGSGGGSGYGGGQTTVLSVQPGTTYRETVVVTAPGGTSIVTSVIERTVQNTIIGGTATVTQAGPTVTASGSGGGVVSLSKLRIAPLNFDSFVFVLGHRYRTRRRIRRGRAGHCYPDHCTYTGQLKFDRHVPDVPDELPEGSGAHEEKERLQFG